MATRVDCDVAVFGAGSGGMGAAISAARMGACVVLVEASASLGGTAGPGGVNMWEPCAGATGLPFEIYRRLKQIPHAVGIYSSGRHFCHDGPEGFPGGESVVDPACTYADTLQRCGTRGLREDRELCRAQWHGVVFEPGAYENVLRELLEETGNASARLATRVADVKVKDGSIAHVLLDDGGTLHAGSYIDATGDGELCVAAGCEFLRGREAKAMFNEPSAPDEPEPQAQNGVTLIFRITPADDACIEDLPDGILEQTSWRTDYPVISAVHYPNGDMNCNMLPTMTGAEFSGLSYDEAYAECERRVRIFWHTVQTQYEEFRRYRLVWIAPRLGVRETRRIVCEEMLTDLDLIAGISHPRVDDIIAIADHARDMHGAGGGCGELPEPYGISYRCLIPKGFRNLLVACRAAGMSSIAASSCRLSRTMMALGQAAGTAAALASRDGTSVPDVAYPPLREALLNQHVQLTWPMPAELRAYLATDE